MNTSFTTTGEPVPPRQDEDYGQQTRSDVAIVKLADRAFIILSIISIIGLAIAYQHFCGVPMAELNTKLNNTEKKLQDAHECENNHYNCMLHFNCSSQCEHLICFFSNSSTGV